MVFKELKKKKIYSKKIERKIGKWERSWISYPADNSFERSEIFTSE